MALRNGRFNVFIKASDSVKSKNKAEETRAHISRLNDMQKFVDLSEEKLNLLMEVIDELIDKGVVVYVELLEVVDKIKEMLEAKGIETLVITGKTTQKKREEASATFMENPHGKVILFSSAGSESLDMNATNEIILYNTCKGSRAFQQTIGRICRGFGDFTKFNIHEIVVEDTLDEYKQVLLSSKRELEQTILNLDTIPLKHDVGSFDAQVLKKVKANMLWKLGKRKRKPKI